MNMKHHVSANLKRLKLPAVSENLEMREREARELSLGYIEFLSLLIQDEIASREANILLKRMQTGSLNPRFTFENFDFQFNNQALPFFNFVEVQLKFN